jgi:hypothetical protein
MASTLIKVIVFIGAIVIGVGVTLFSTNILNEGNLISIDTNTEILIGVVMVVFTYIALYFMTKGSGQ